MKQSFSFYLSTCDNNKPIPRQPACGVLKLVEMEHQSQNHKRSSVELMGRRENRGDGIDGIVLCSGLLHSKEYILYISKHVICDQVLFDGAIADAFYHLINSRLI